VLFFVLGVAIFYFYKKPQFEKNNAKFIFNNFSQSWEQTYKTDDLNRDEILENEDNSDSLHNQSIIRGFFDSYNPPSQELKIKMVVPFTRNSLFEYTILKFQSEKDTYCVSDRYTDPNTGKSYDFQKIIFPTKDNQLIYVPTEKAINFNDFIKKTNTKNYLIIQLTKKFNKEEINYIKKLIVVGLCD